MRPVKKIPASVTVIAYNEEARIRTCLNSVKNFDEIIVLIDQKTTDNTEKVASEFECQDFF